jgi:hypothetical protein
MNFVVEVVVFRKSELESSDATREIKIFLHLIALLYDLAIIFPWYVNDLGSIS